MILQIVGASILLLGTFVCMFGAIGLLRLPNFFARTHGASITDTWVPLVLAWAWLFSRLEWMSL